MGQDRATSTSDTGKPDGEIAIHCRYDKLVAPEKLRPHPMNPSRHPEAQVELLAKIMRAHGVRHGITVSRQSGFIVAGHCRAEAGRLLGLKGLPVTYQDFASEAEELAVLVADNKVAELAETDGSLMGDIIVELDQVNYPLELTALSPTEIEDYVVGPTGPDPKDDVVPDPPKKAKTKVGDLYILGDHRLLCGDSTKAEDVQRLMGGQKADMVFTSPPYNLGSSVQLSGNKVMSQKQNAYNDFDDRQSESMWLSLLQTFSVVWLKVCRYLFVNIQSLAGNRWALWSYIYSLRDSFCDVAIWDKEHAPPAAAARVMNSRFEFVFIFSNEKANRAISISPTFRGTVDNVYKGPPQRENICPTIHGATFPVHLPEHFISTFTKAKALIGDSFLGSGTTLIACEKLKRRCFGMEIDPIYVDVAVRRWEDFTGKKAELVRE